MGRFFDVVFGAVRGRILINFGAVLGPSGTKKTAKNVERYFDFAFLRFFVWLVLEDRFRTHFGPILAPKNDPKSTQKLHQKRVGISTPKKGSKTGRDSENHKQGRPQKLSIQLFIDERYSTNFLSVAVLIQSTGAPRELFGRTPRRILVFFGALGRTPQRI